MAQSSPEGIILSKGSTLVSLDLSIDSKKVLSIGQKQKTYTQEEVKQLLIECCSEVSCEDGTLVGKTPAELFEWIEQKFKQE